MTDSYRAALAEFCDRDAGRGWSLLPFFTSGQADALARALDARVAQGTHVLPPAADVFAALRLTPPEAVKVVILGQDPYPTPGHAHGLAFSVREGVRIPRSLANIYREREADLGLPPSAHGHLGAWAQQGVLMLNTCLTVEAGMAGSHRKLGWASLTGEIIQHVADAGAVFILWGTDSEKAGAAIDEGRNGIIRSAHPSPLSARRGFFGSRPFSRANAWLVSRGKPAIDWRN